jgi:hypothetical protein
MEMGAVEKLEIQLCGEAIWGGYKRLYGGFGVPSMNEV